MAPVLCAVVCEFIAQDIRIACSKHRIERLRYRFALQATPLRPPGRDMWEDRLVRSNWYGEGMAMGEKMVGDTPALQHYAATGARGLLVWRWWDAFAYPLPIGHEDEFRAMVADYHGAGL